MDDLVAYEASIRPEGWADPSARLSVSPNNIEQHLLLDDSWLTPLLGPFDVHSDCEIFKCAKDEGVTLFHIRSEQDAEAAAAHFHQYGFVVLLNVLQQNELCSLRETSAELIRCAVRAKPEGNRGKQRWSLHRTTMVKSCIGPVDNPSVCGVLEKIWRSSNFYAQVTGGDFSLPGAEAQQMHADVSYRSDVGKLLSWCAAAGSQRSFLNLVSPVIKVYLPMVDLDKDTGPPLFLPGCRRYQREDDVPGNPPLGRRAFCPKGGAIIMDPLVWHHGTPNISKVARPMLSIHYAAPWYSEGMLKGSNVYFQRHLGAVSNARLQAMSPRARELCRNIGPEQASGLSWRIAPVALFAMASIQAIRRK